MILPNILSSFLAGLAAPLGAVCVLPLYPGYLSYIAGKMKKPGLFIPTLLITSGIIISMLIFGLVFTAILQESLSMAIGVISPIAFSILLVISVFLLFNYDFGNLLPKLNTPVKKDPYVSSLLFGLFFGAVVLPCNPAPLTVLFAVSTSPVGFVLNLLNFILFGVGMATPLLVFAAVSFKRSQQVIGWIAEHRAVINRLVGIVMLLISVYYLFVVFQVQKLVVG